MDPIIETTSPILTLNPRNKPTEARDAIAVDRIVLRNDLRLYIREAWHVVEPSTVYLENWHIDLIAEYLEAVTAGQIKRLLINMPPRYAKSRCVSIMWPTWVWAREPFPGKTERVRTAPPFPDVPGPSSAGLCGGPWLAQAEAAILMAELSSFTVVSVVVGWEDAERPNLYLHPFNDLYSWVFFVFLIFLILRQFFRAGPITPRRVQESIAVYMLLGLLWAVSSEIVELLDPDPSASPRNVARRPSRSSVTSASQPSRLWDSGTSSP
jgi:hypothetical protein